MSISFNNHCGTVFSQVLNDPRTPAGELTQRVQCCPLVGQCITAGKKVASRGMHHKETKEAPRSKLKTDVMDLSKVLRMGMLTMPPCEGFRKSELSEGSLSIEIRKAFPYIP